MSLDQAGVTQEVECLDCGHEWKDEYVLQGVKDSSQNDTNALEAFTVVSVYEESGQIVCDHVVAQDKIAAMKVVRDSEERSDATVLMATDGHQNEGRTLAFADRAV